MCMLQYQTNGWEPEKKKTTKKTTTRKHRRRIPHDSAKHIRHRTWRTTILFHLQKGHRQKCKICKTVEGKHNYPVSRECGEKLFGRGAKTKTKKSSVIIITVLILSKCNSFCLFLFTVSPVGKKTHRIWIFEFSVFTIKCCKCWKY